MAMTDSMRSTITVEVEDEADTRVTAEEATGAGAVRAATSAVEDEVVAVVVEMDSEAVHEVEASAAALEAAAVSRSRLVHISLTATLPEQMEEANLRVVCTPCRKLLSL